MAQELGISFSNDTNWLKYNGYIVNGIGTYLVYISLALLFSLFASAFLTGKEEQPNGDHKFVLLTTFNYAYILQLSLL